MPNKALSNITSLNVALDFGSGPKPVGRLATKNRIIYFEYDTDFLQQYLEISPYSLRLKRGVTTFDIEPFEGLPGVFNDSLPDGWGQLLIDRALRTKGLRPETFSPLDRLAYVGKHGMGALIYEPDHSETGPEALINLDELSKESSKILEGESSDVIAELLALNGSSAGARPKAMIAVNKHKTQIIQGIGKIKKGYEPWIVKFSNINDGLDAGAVEFVYNQMARIAGLTVTDSFLFPAQKGPGYFATKRFDRIPNNGRLHMHTAAGLLHVNFRIPSLDYEDLIKATMFITRDIREAKKMYQFAVFNVLSFNRDDHAKNFSYLMNRKGEWSLSPAYDLTFSRGPGGEQSTMIRGEGKAPGRTQLLDLASTAQLTEKEAQAIIERTLDALGQWQMLAKESGVQKNTIAEIQQNMERVING